MITAATDIQFLKGVGEKRAVVLKSKGIDTIGALLRFYPRKYLDWTDIKPISEASFFENVCIKARIITPIETIEKRKGMTIFKFMVEDSSATAHITMFNQHFLANRLRTGREYLFYGRVDGNFYIKQMTSPIIMESSFGGIEPIYQASKTISSKVMEKLVKTALQSVEMVETLPLEIRERNGLCDIKTALWNIHFPKTKEGLKSAQKRLVFEELFVLQAGLTFLKKRSRGKTACLIEKNYFDDFKGILPFLLTNAQQRVINECFEDMKSGRPMNRLVQGDVGSGKTAVCAALMYITAKNGYQSALMAPTEILAEQHYKTIKGFFENSGLMVALLTGATTKKQKAVIKEQLKTGEIDIIIGTHALISDDVEFKSLGLVVTDEQHRFGVAQRGKLSSKGENPHTLVMSATPIPRTLGLILYGDLDISIIDEYPKGRQKIDTYLVDTNYRQRIYNYIKKFLNEGRQGYIVCPLVEENEVLDITPATEYYEKLKENDFKGYSLGLLHGKMSSKEKESVMRDFSEGKIQLLIATTVIEVGIDVPNAVIMVIENAERFGLSQLHQLRGRIGRGKYKSDCILISDNKSDDTKKRLDVIKNTADGFKIADADLELRGPGDFLGSRQHGLPDMKIADLFADRDVLHKAGREVEYLIKNDPSLKLEENLGLREEIIALYKKLNNN
ncbi:MAG: ATP-dependent DNA helicase RecG [Clostridia bacterium]|nr:ATP-dependent DNA helicase RecG [Clostridia bacterium]